jgi:Flp pilus assembly protein TadD
LKAAAAFVSSRFVDETVSKMKKLFPLILGLSLVVLGHAQNLRITIPKRTKPTPVQKLNQDGVKAINKHKYDDAKKLFYKAYLLDPNDPFTLNNLGYIAELDGDVERAQRFYELAREQNSDALVARSTVGDLKGKTVAQVAGHADQAHMQVNELNVAALNMLVKDRAPEADMLLTRSLALDPKNAFTLNNLGYAKEKEGEYDQALDFYLQAANLHSNQPIVVTAKKDWRGKPISEVAADNAGNVRKLIRRAQRDKGFQVAMLNLRGVSALNRNDRSSARKYFQQAYDLDKGNAFALNNMGYLAELQGDEETAQFYYDKAQEARQAQDRVEIATRKSAEGERLRTVADVSESSVEKEISSQVAQKRQQGPPKLVPRGAENQPPDTQPNPPQEQPQQPPDETPPVQQTPTQPPI